MISRLSLDLHEAIIIPHPLRHLLRASAHLQEAFLSDGFRGLSGGMGVSCVERTFDITVVGERCVVCAHCIVGRHTVG